MATERPEVTRVQLLLNALFLSSELQPGGILGHAPLRWVSEWLGLDPAEHFGEEALRHLVAIQLAPRTAINYDSSNPTPRWRLVDDYLAERFSLSAGDRVPISRLVASILDAAAQPRGARILAAERALECSICRLPFQGVPESVATLDPYKPVWQAPEELSRPEIDHVVPISSLGSHQVQNLQIVCRACNLAKGGGLTIDPAAEIRYAACPPVAVPRIHFFRLLQWLIQRSRGRCETCGGNTGELTMRPVHSTSPIARTTLRLTCYDCLAPTPS